MTLSLSDFNLNKQNLLIVRIRSGFVPSRSVLLLINQLIQDNFMPDASITHNSLHMDVST